ncbi:MAG: hypothetical protein NZM35_04590 [Chitinophagales bacterium]|nr:hypothetical protein [Chitinophagales bacterium]MDW8418814.1 hypothetical protein [Chitinophagales bacterium]
MRQSVILLLISLLLTGCKSCKDKTDGNVIIHVHATFGNQPLSFVNTFYNDGAGKEYFFSKLKFYLSHVQLIRTDNTPVPLTDAAYIDWSDEAWKKFIGKADAGTYKGLRFFVGLDKQQNSLKPDDYDADHPLGPKDEMFWEWLGYRFINFEGRADTAGQNFTGGSVGLVYHVGRDTCYREVTLSGAEFTVQNSGKKAIRLNLDLMKIFTGTDAINAFQYPGTQSEDYDLHIAIRFADRFAQSFDYTPL